MAGLQIIDLHKSFGRLKALAGVSFEVEKGEIVAVLGPSGCGKSTLLSMVAGLDKPEAGEIRWEGFSLAGVPAHRRNFGLMFQDYALFPHLSVGENVAFSLHMQGQSRGGIVQRVKELLDLVGLTGYEQRDVNTLSGGETQRVALARSCAPIPRLLMLDEPLGALDRTLRERLEVELRAILKNLRQTVLYVTHDQEEAFTMADRVVVMNAGKVEQIGTPQAIYCQPASLFVAEFLGFRNFLPGTLSRSAGKTILETPLGAFLAETPMRGAVTVLLHPDAVSMDGSGDTFFEGLVVESSFKGSLCRSKIKIRETELVVDFPPRLTLPEAGQPFRMGLVASEALLLYDQERLLDNARIHPLNS